MKVFSYMRHGIELVPIEIEISFLPGLPQMQFLGRPDSSLKESQWRIKSALKQQGFDWPKGNQIIINLRPNHLPKSSRGLDLAIACAFLWKSEQVKVPLELGDVPTVFGELGLDGAVEPPDDLDLLTDLNSVLLTGPCLSTYSFPIIKISQLKDLRGESNVTSREGNLKCLATPVIPDMKFSAEAARILEVSAHGEHNLLLAGPAGSGKSTLVEALPYILNSPNSKDTAEILKWSKLMGKPVDWRPVVSPHHSIPTISMVGGGVPAIPGEVTRAHGGVLILDELLEFNNQVKEALREPIQSGQITVSRRGEVKVFPAQFLLLATSNLCPCGDLVPKKISSCRFSLTRCRSYLEKLSGPLADRFAILNFTHAWGKELNVSLEQISGRVKVANEFARKSRQQFHPNSRLRTENLTKDLCKLLQLDAMPEILGSKRRHLSFLQVARSLADFDQSLEILPEHVEESKELAYLPFRRLNKIFS